MRTRWPAAALSAALLVAAGCGGERTFTADEFVEEVRANGVELELGEELITDQEGKELYAVDLEPLAGTEGPEGEGEEAHGGPEREGEEEHTGGSLSVYDDTEGADRELANCRASADLLCYQAANVVVVLEGGGIEAERLAVAMRQLAED